MMPHLLQHDWLTSKRDEHFVTEADLDRCVTMRIIRNKFHNPMLDLPSDSEGEDRLKPDPKPRTKINWDEILKKPSSLQDTRHHRLFVAALRKVPPFPKLSVLTPQEHYQCLKVLCSQNPDVLSTCFMARPTKQDHKVFEQVKDKYEKEQKEYIEWAKTLWTNDHCIRALRPKPDVEMLYEAEFKMKENKMALFPKNFKMAAMITLESKNNKFQLVHQKDLKTVAVTELPQIECPELSETKVSIQQPCSVPEPCTKHPCQFILPTEKSLSILPLKEIHRELAQYALDNGAHYIASENALKCLLEQDREWMLPLSVCQVLDVAGESYNVIVMDSEFFLNRESALVRTHRAYRHLLEQCFVPSSEKKKFLRRLKKATNDKKTDKSSKQADNANNRSSQELNTSVDDMDVGSDDEDNLVIDADFDELVPEEAMEVNLSKANSNEHIDKQPELFVFTGSSTPDASSTAVQATTKNTRDTEFYTCTCIDSFVAPPPRSFNKWQLRNSTTNEKYDVIVHSPHKVKGDAGEAILEPITEYQTDLGGREQSPKKTESLALSLLLRKKATLLNVRIEGGTGEVITIERHTLEELLQEHGDLITRISNTLHTAVDQLQGLLPGSYVLKHESGHGSNALLYAARAGADELVLQFDCARPADTDEAKQLKTPPTLTAALLPVHKFRKILPCAFTPFSNQVAKEPSKKVTRQKAPPQAIKWPKRKLRQKPKVDYS